MKATAPTAAVNSIRVTKANAAYHIRLYLAPEVLERERDKSKGRTERGRKQKGEQGVKQMKRANEDSV